MCTVLIFNYAIHRLRRIIGLLWRYMSYVTKHLSMNVTRYSVSVSPSLLF